VIATDTDAVYTGWGTPQKRALSHAHPDALARMDFAPGSMEPKVEAAIEFVRSTGNDALIGSLADLPALLSGTAGSRVSLGTERVVLPRARGRHYCQRHGQRLTQGLIRSGAPGGGGFLLAVMVANARVAPAQEGVGLGGEHGYLAQIRAR
jgi:hypothetical protein